MIASTSVENSVETYPLVSKVEQKLGGQITPPNLRQTTELNFRSLNLLDAVAENGDRFIIAIPSRCTYYQVLRLSETDKNSGYYNVSQNTSASARFHSVEFVPTLGVLVAHVGDTPVEQKSFYLVNPRTLEIIRSEKSAEQFTRRQVKTLSETSHLSILSLPIPALTPFENTPFKNISLPDDPSSSTTRKSAA